MRVIDAGLGAVSAVAVSPDGRFVAAAAADAFVALHWATGEIVMRDESHAPCHQLRFGPAGNWVARGRPHHLLRLQAIDRDCLTEVLPAALASFSGGVTVSPDRKVLVAATSGVGTGAGKSPLVRWTLPGLHSIPGFDFSSPFQRLAFSPDGQFLAGIWSEGFELRFAKSDGLDYRHRMPRGHDFHGPGFVNFDRASGACAFGWEHEFHVLDISTGTSKPGPRVEAPFRDAAFSPGADLFSTVGDDGRLKLWNPRTWRVVREYDWNCGPLTCLAFSADGSAGVCGTADGRLVQFDVDE